MTKTPDSEETETLWGLQGSDSVTEMERGLTAVTCLNTVPGGMFALTLGGSIVLAKTSLSGHHGVCDLSFGQDNIVGNLAGLV